MIDMTARLVIVALVEELRMTCKKGWSNVGASNVSIFLYVARSLLSFAKADSSGLSCTLLPFLPLKPQRLARVVSSSAGVRVVSMLLLLPMGSILGVPPLELLRLERAVSGISSEVVDGPPPSIAETEL